MARRAVSYSIAVFFLLMSSVPALAYTEGRIPFSRLVERANTIVLGTVDELESMERFFGDYVRIVTQADLGDLDLIKGDPDATVLAVHQFGGQVGDVIEWYPGLPKFELGLRYLIFLVQADNGLSVPIGAQGFFVVREDPQSGENLVFTASGQVVLGVEDDWVVYGANAGEEGDAPGKFEGAIPLDRFLDHINAALQ